MATVMFMMPTIGRKAHVMATMTAVMNTMVAAMLVKIIAAMMLNVAVLRPEESS